ncbi:TPA: hypothetical protein ACSTJ0_004832 [Serratia fonticola]|uniref:hypothetical protein n=1 Tax=Serratia fonticola TaxID=47917 RepID=UPI000B10DB3D|nr:hypothetical protein [Serratia fonticola]CAI0981649.1 Uncharacterised protein [Serratia fonticola]CAI1211916.1 Uncharacterised protein [Serratia fonticola]CAI1572427.1 Uncharacterised protein [Serratia fonticola]CAI1719205.1 Uncharacterised protein [Serratia fonticola]CAI1858566.1 Uncharacterised protein [Serratia fonticola]
MNTGVGERELSAIVGEPVPLREVGNLPMLWLACVASESVGEVSADSIGSLSWGRGLG